jgi:serine/threonine protein kinase
MRRSDDASKPNPDPGGANPFESDVPGDSSLAASLEEFLGLVKAGKRPSREEFLASCGDPDGALADCLDGLEFILSAAPDLGQPEPSGDDPAAGPGPLAPDSRLGDYRVVREVGRGGMGVVYEAEQVSLGRRVALKVLPFAAALDPKHRQRFQLEAQAAAHLHHPHIVPVFAVGRDEGIHYYAMQFVDGRSLAGVVRELRRQARAAARPPEAPAVPPPVAPAGSTTSIPGSDGLTPQPGSGITTRSRAFFRTVARLGMQAAEALEHAHALGVIHRDVKPANLLIDARGDLYVTDFGLARFLDDPGMTRTGDLMGTLAYMSPEQALGRREVDHRTDIYSLGATLYELLTLRTAFEGRDRQVLLRKIAQDEPARPKKLNPSVPRDLETVILKAMEKEPSGRYPAARELAEDLRRFLADEPVHARRPNLFEKTAKWAKRHRPVVATAAVLLPLSMAVAGGLLWAEQRRTAQANQALRENILATFTVSDAANMMAMQRFSADAMQANGTDRPVDADAFFRTVLNYYEKVAQYPATDTEMRAIVARAHHRVGFTLAVMRKPHSPWQQSFRLAVAEFEALIREEPRERHHKLNLAYALNDWAMLLTVGHGLEAAEPLYHRAIEIRKAVALDSPPVEPDELGSLASYELSWAAGLESAGRKGEAEQTRQSLTDFYRELARRLPGDTSTRRILAEAHRLPGLMVDQAGDRITAERFYRLALILDPTEPLACNNLAWLLVNDPYSLPFNPQEAAPLARIAAAGRPDDGAIMNTLGVAEYRVGRYIEGARALERSMALRAGGDPADWLFLAMIYARTGDAARAWTWYASSCEWIARSGTKNSEFRRFQREATELFASREPADNAPDRPRVTIRSVVREFYRPTTSPSQRSVRLQTID